VCPWPGNLLEPLQNAWADGKITKTEARQFARLLGQIRKKASRRENEQQSANAVKIAAQAARTLDLAWPLLPAIPFSTRIKSHTTRATFYDVDLNGPTCTCPDFGSYRSKLPTRHLTRCCKHIFDAYAQFELPDGWPGWLGWFLRVAATPHPHKEWRVIPIGQGWLGMRTVFVLISSAPKDWADVFAPNNRGCSEGEERAFDCTLYC
jgi:hypothetical protein